jgi:hypothetical protein
MNAKGSDKTVFISTNLESCKHAMDCSAQMYSMTKTPDTQHFISGTVPL